VAKPRLTRSWVRGCFISTFVTVITILLAACATDVATYHTGCMESFRAFADQVACVKNSVQGDPSLRGDTLVQEYVLAGEALARQVQAGKLTEDQARLQFTHRLNDIQQRQADLLAQQARAASPGDFMRPHFTNCHRAGNEVECTSY
jgi:hypothetical protein